MFKTVTELQKFILWAKKNQIKHCKVDNIEFNISEASFFTTDLEATPEKAITGDTLVDTEPQDSKEYEELLLWSTQK